MRNKHPLLQWILLAPVLATSAAPTRGSKHREKPEPYVQIFSVSANPEELRAGGEPNTALLTVKVITVLDNGSSLPPGATVLVEAGEYSSSPPGNEISIEGNPQTRPLSKAGKAVFTFKIHTGPGTVDGSITVQADIRGVSKGLTV